MSGRGRSTGGSGRSQGRGGGREGSGSSNARGCRGRGGGSGRQQRTNVHSAPPTPSKYRSSSTNAINNVTDSDYVHSRAATPASYSNNNSSRSSAPRGHTSLYNNNAAAPASASKTAAQTSKRDGERGASAHTVSEQYRIQLTNLLMNFRETTSDQDSITLPSNLTNTQRKFVHELSKQLGLNSKSYGKGEERKVVVSKIFHGGGGGGDSSGIMSIINGSNRDGSSSSSCTTNALPTLDEYKQVPRINVGKSGEEALRNHISKYPPSLEEEAESKETGSSFLMKRNNVSEPRDDVVEGDNDNTIEKAVLEENLALAALNDVARAPLLHLRKQQLQQHTKIIQSRMQNHASSQKLTMSHPQFANMMKQRRSLPAFQYAQDICNVLRNKRNQVVILTGDTGCGKSTQVPQFLLDDPQIGPTCNILITQPRRISAISVAERVASERCESVGQSVGYSVRLEGCSSKKTQLLFCTPGVLMKRLHPTDDGGGRRRSSSAPSRNFHGLGVDDAYNSGGTGIQRLTEITHLIMDEIHERDKNTEFLMIALQDLLEERDDLQLILMSATMPTRDLAEYWCGVGRRRRLRQQQQQQQQLEKSDAHSLYATNNDVSLGGSESLAIPVEINIPGRTFPVQEFFLEDVLSMTGFVSNAKVQAPDMVQIESDLLSFLSGPNTKESSSETRGNSTDESSLSISLLGNSLTCVMCNRSGFRCAEEFGTHVALCDGGGGMSMLDLEDRVKSVDVTSIHKFDASTLNATSTDTAIDYGLAEFADENYDDDEEVCGLIGGKWDGESPFGTDIAAPSNKLSLTDEELLTRYQTMYDDEETNCDLILELVRYVHKSSYGDGAILVFFSGWSDISEFSMLLESTPPFNNGSQFVVYPLHSGIPSKDQRQVFIKPPRGVRKIILATNIAETSLTIEDVAFVIDTGRAKEKSYDPHLKTSTLQESWISQASAKQRKGRAGRCKAGVCFHLFSRRRHASMRPFVESELIRTPLEEICLQCKRLRLAPGGPEDPDGIPAFLAKAMTPPHSKSVMNAIELLVELGAMDEETNELTDLGLCLSGLSLEPRVGKMVIMSYLVGCAKASSSMAVAMSYKSPFTIPPPSMRKLSDNAKIKLSERSESDQITSLNVLRNRDAIAKRGQGALVGWCKQNMINLSSLNMISELRNVVSRELEGLGFPPCSQSGHHNRSGDFNPAFLQASICAGLYPNLAFRRSGDINFSTISNKKAKIHLGSVNAIKSQPLSSKCQVAEDQVEFIVFGELVKGKAMFTMENTTHLVSPLPLILLCGRLHIKQVHFAPSDMNCKLSVQMSILSLDNWLVFLCEPETASALVVLRQRLDSAFSRITSDPSNFTDLPAAEKDAVETLSFVLNSSHAAAPRR